MKILLVLQGAWIAPRFDLATEVLIIQIDDQGNRTGEPRDILLPGPSAEELCSLILKEGITHVICGGIEEAHYRYLTWKGLKVMDHIIGTGREVVHHFLARGETSRSRRRWGSRPTNPPPSRCKTAACPRRTCWAGKGTTRRAPASRGG